MENIKSGDIFIFLVDSKYGLIQVIENSKSVGQNVRVFCDLIEKTDDETIENIINNGDFYYIKNFYDYDLIYKSEYKISYELSKGITMPKYMRSSERKLNGDLFWYVIDIDKGKIVKTFNGFDEGLVDLSPYNSWGIEYIERRWREGFSLKQWNDELENRWYMDYLKKFEPEKTNGFKIKKASIIEKWIKEKRFSNTITDSVNDMFKIFRKRISISARDSLDVNKIIKQLIENLNEINNKHHFIGTQESEELIGYIYNILNIYNCSDTDDIVDRFRNW